MITLKIIQEKVNKNQWKHGAFQHNEALRKNQANILELQNTVSEIKHSLHGFNSRLETEDLISF